MRDLQEELKRKLLEMKDLPVEKRITILDEALRLLGWGGARKWMVSLPTSA